MNLVDFIVAAIATLALWSIATSTEALSDEAARIRKLLEEEEECCEETTVQDVRS